jgi:histidinol phosphatase-like PHP family hydrolase
MTLVVDLHTHSVFSDGHVWPSVRVGEAIADGLDAVAITEHLEWQPHLDDIPHRFTFRVLNALVAPDQHPEVAFSVAIAEAAPGPG